MGGLELGRDGEVDVQPALAPQVDVLDVRRADDGRGLRRLDAREGARDEVDLVARGARDEEVGVRDSGVAERLPARTVRLDRADVVAVGERLEALAHDVDDDEVVIAVERLHDGRPHLSRADDHDPHARRRVSLPGVGTLNGRITGRRVANGYPRRVRRIAVLASVVCGAIVAGSSLAASPSGLRLVRVAGGLESPIFATQAPGEPQRIYVVEQPGRIRVVEKRKAAGGGVPRHPLAGPERRRAGAARARVLAALRARRHVLRALLAARDGDTIVARYRARTVASLPAAAARSFGSTSRTRTTTAVTSPSAPTAAFAVGLGDGGRAATPRTGRRTWTPSLGKMLPPGRPQGAARPRDRRARLNNPSRYSFDRATRRPVIATWAELPRGGRIGSRGPAPTW